MSTTSGWADTNSKETDVMNAWCDIEALDRELAAYLAACDLELAGYIKMCDQEANR